MGNQFATSNRSPLYKALPGAVTGLGASQQAVIKFPPGATYDTIYLQCLIGAGIPTRVQLETMLLDMQLTISGQEIWTVSAKQLIAISEWYQVGITGALGMIKIPSARYWLTKVEQQLGLRIGTLGESSMQLTINQDATTTIDSITPLVRIAPVAEELGAYVRMQRLTPNWAVGQNVFDGFTKIGSANEYLYALHFQVPVIADFTFLTVQADSVRLVDNLNWTQLNQFQALGGPKIRTPQTAKLFQSLDFCAMGLDDDSVQMNMDSLLLLATFANTNPGLVNIIAEIGSVAPSKLAG